MPGNDSSVLRAACGFEDGSDVDIDPLPEQVARLLQDLNAPPRLAAHLRVVRAATSVLLQGLHDYFPALAVDSEAILFGAATHDIGKVAHLAELISPGSLHEALGEQLLIEHGVPAERARFARTHAAWRDPDCTTEDLVVALADKIWKGQRENDLEQLVVERVTAKSHWEAWDAYMQLEDLLTGSQTVPTRGLRSRTSTPLAEPPRQASSRPL